MIGAADFFTTEVWTGRGLVTYFTLFVIDIATRAVHIAGTTPNPDGSFMAQVARNLTDDVDGFLRSKRFLIIDRDSKFSDEFKSMLRNAGVTPVVSSEDTPVVMADAGVENFNGAVDELVDSGPLRRVLAFTELKFSNKHQWLFLHSLDRA